MNKDYKQLYKKKIKEIVLKKSISSNNSNKENKNFNTNKNII